MTAIELSNEQARQFLLLKQGLIGDYRFYNKQGVLEYIQQAGCIQFDPIDVCGKNAELVLQSRVNGFSKDMLYELLYEDRSLIDYFDKNMSILCTQDWKYFQRQRLSHQQYSRSRDAVNAVAQGITDAIQAKGFVSSKDLDLKQQVDWAWNPTSLARAALETMYFRGDLVLHHKKGTNKYYTLTRGTLPEEILCADDPNPGEEAYFGWRVLRRIGAVGLLWNKPSDAWLGIDGLKAAQRSRAFEKLLEEEKLLEVSVEGIAETLYCLASDRPWIDRVQNESQFTARTELIAALDNLLWDRRLIKKIFDFEYKWEIYTPIVERKFGHYVLPILSGSQFIGRAEIIHDKVRKDLLLKNIWYEKNTVRTDALDADLAACLQRFAAFHGCKGILTAELSQEG
jgi:uncharacterized protein